MQQFGIAFLPDVAAFYTGLAGMADRCRQRVRNPESGHVGFRLRGGTVVRSRCGWLLHRRRARAYPPAARRSTSMGLSRASDPSGFTYAVFNTPHDLPFWKDTARCSGGRCLPARGGDRQRSGRGGRSHSRGVPGWLRLAAGVDRDPVLPVRSGIRMAYSAATARHELDGDRRGRERALLLGIRPARPLAK